LYLPSPDHADAQPGRGAKCLQTQTQLLQNASSSLIIKHPTHTSTHRTAHTHTRTHARTHARTHKHTHAHTHAHTRTPTHTCVPWGPSVDGSERDLRTRPPATSTVGWCCARPESMQIPRTHTHTHTQAHTQTKTKAKLFSESRSR
jgi:hypothetical protein